MSTATAKKKSGKTVEREIMETGAEAINEAKVEGMTAEVDESEEATGKETKAPVITTEELAQKTAEEKLRLEDTLCTQADWLADATVEFNNANNHAKECKKHLESVQVKVNETFTKLADVLSGNWRPDPQRELPFPESEVGGEISPALWKSEPVTSLDLPKTILAKLDQEGFSTVGQLALELEGQRFAGLNLGEKQITKIQNAVDFVVERAEELAKEQQAATSQESTEEHPES